LETYYQKLFLTQTAPGRYEDDETSNYSHQGYLKRGKKTGQKEGAATIFSLGRNLAKIQ